MPLPRTLRRLIAACVLLCLAVLPALGAGSSTSTACLERCAEQCRNAPGGETDRAVCLGSCLDGCSVACGTVDVPCAQDCMNKASASAWAEPRNLAAACAGICRTAQDCPPQGKAVLSRPAARAKLKQTLARIKKKGMDETFVARDRSFSVAVPWDWDLVEDAGLGPDGDYELKATAPDTGFLSYVQFSVRHVSDPGRTAEGFVNALQAPGALPVRKDLVVGKGQVDGREATLVTSRSVRSMYGSAEQVQSEERLLVLPLPAGFMVLASDVPAAAKDKHAAQMERLFQGFRLLAAPQAAAQEVTAEEYAVYGAFLASKGITEKGRELKPKASDAQPPYLEYAARARSVDTVTRSGPELGQKVLDGFAKVCGALDPTLAQDYGQKRGQHLLLADRIPLPGVRMRGEKQGGAGLAMERRRPPTGEELLFGPSISFSRVGFSAGGDTALFHVANLGDNPGTSYLVLMVKREGAWKLSCALLDEMRIY